MVSTRLKLFVYLCVLTVAVLAATACSSRQSPPASQPAAATEAPRRAGMVEVVTRVPLPVSWIQGPEGDSGASAASSVLPAPQAQGGVFPGEPFNGLQVEYSVSGAELGPPTDEPGFTWHRQQDGRVTGKMVVVSGVAHATSGWGADLVVRVSAGDAEPVEYKASKHPEHGLYPANAEPDPMNESFSVSIDVPPAAETVEFSIDLTGDYNAGSRSVVVSGRLINGIPWPCKEPKFFYPGMTLDGYFTGSSPLRFSRDEMTADLVGALKRFVSEGNDVETGVGFTDVHAAAKAFISTALPTGKEEALQNAARQLARQRQQTDPNARLTPGDLFYLSLKLNNGNVRDALFTAHAALYRDGQGVNKKFIEQENVLTPLRDPEGYVDGEYKYKTPQGHERSINPRRGLSGDEQGVWYHFFGLTTLEFTDMYGSASYYAARLAIWGGALQSNYTDKVIQRGFPTSKLGGALGSLAIALEDNVRTNMGKPPDIAKYCINYYALAAGRGLMDVMWEYYENQPKPYKERFNDFANTGDVLRPTGVVIYKSPLSILIQGANGEWFSFDPQSGKVDGNSPLLYFEIFPEDDGSLGFLGSPFFEVTSMQMAGVGEGPVTLGLYESASKTSGVYEFNVHAGDEIAVEGFAATPLLNGTPLKKSAQEKGILPIGPASGNRLGFLLIVGCGGLLFLLLIVSLAIFLTKRRKRSPRPAAVSAPAPVPARREPAAFCPHCGAKVNPNARFCEQCGQPADAAAVHPSPPLARSGGNRCLFVAGIGVLVLLCLLALVAAGFLYFSPLGRQMIGLAATPTTAPIAVAPPAATGTPPVPTIAKRPPATVTSAPTPAPTQPPSGQGGTLATPTAPAPAPAAVPSPALTGQQRLDDHALFDDFSSNTLGWSQRNNASAETGYENEQYFMLVKQPTYWVMSKVPGEFPHTVIEFDAAVAPVSASGMYGVICHYLNDNNYDFVAIDPETSSFSAGRLQDGAFQFLSGAADGTTEQPSQYLARSLTDSNHIAPMFPEQVSRLLGLQRPLECSTGYPYVLILALPRLMSGAAPLPLDPATPLHARPAKGLLQVRLAPNL